MFALSLAVTYVCLEEILEAGEDSLKTLNHVFCASTCLENAIERSVGIAMNHTVSKRLESRGNLTERLEDPGYCLSSIRQMLGSVADRSHVRTVGRGRLDQDVT